MGRLALASVAVAVFTWSFVGVGGAATDTTLPAPRGPVRVSVDGLVGTVSSASTVDEALRAAGLSRGGSGRLSAAPDAAVVAGSRIAVDRGIPVVVIDGGTEAVVRTRPGTVAELLAAEGLALGPLDRIEPDMSATLQTGLVVRITRIFESDETVAEARPFTVRLISDPALERGVQVVVTPGQPGAVVTTYHIRTEDGREVTRAVLSSIEQAVAVEEVRRVGVRLPATPGNIEAIIREAAERQGADPDQLLRVAWCESRYNPNAVNTAGSGAAGLFQFMPGTWAANSARAGYAGASVFDPVASANVAAWMFARGQAAQWTCR